MMKPWYHFSEVTVAHYGWEMLLMRGLFSWLLWQLLPGSIPFIHQPIPNGVGHLFDLTFLADQNLFFILRIGYGLALLVFISGLLPIISLGYVALLLIMVGALENSQGAIGHHLQLACMVASAQWIVYVCGVRGGGKSALKPSIEVHQRATHWAKIVIVASYVTSACVKLIASGGLWIIQLPDVSLQLIKTHANVYYDTLWAQTEWVANELPHFISNHPNLTRIFFTPGLLLEVFAFIAITGRRGAGFIGVGLLFMHLLVRWVMNLSFSAHEWLLMIYLINLPYWGWFTYHKSKGDFGNRVSGVSTSR
jgi:hypothetical protein